MQDTLPPLGSRTYFVRPSSKLSTKYKLSKSAQVTRRKVKLGSGPDIQIGDSDYVSVYLQGIQYTTINSLNKEPFGFQELRPLLRKIV